MNEQRLAGELAIVTGSDSGIGKATAMAFAQDGADVVITYFRDRQGAEQSAREVEAAGRKAATYQLDQRSSANVRQLFQDVRSSIGIPTILLNNAGIDALGKMVADMTDEDWHNTIHTNFSGPFYCCPEFINQIEG